MEQSASVRRIVTHRYCFDGLVSALLLQQALGVEPVAFESPREMRERQRQVWAEDAVADLPLPPGGCALWFDHHECEKPRAQPGACDPAASSCSRVIFDWYPQLERYRTLVAEADRLDRAGYSLDELDVPCASMQIAMSLESQDIVRDERYAEFLLQMLSESGLERVAGYSVVRERFRAAYERHQRLLSLARRIARRRGAVLLVELPEPGPRWKPFLLLLFRDHPEAALLLVLSPSGERLDISVGENPWLSTNVLDLAKVMAAYGGGGHRYAAGGSIPKSAKDQVLELLLAALNAQ